MRSTKSYGVAVVLVVVFGFLGAHRFYAGRWVTAILQAATLGGFGVWWVIDIFAVAFGGFTDVDRRVIRWA